MNYLKKFLEFINTHNLLSKDDKILVGFSGGKDSVFLTHLLLSANFKIALAHLNHSLRGDESIRDMQFSLNFSKKYNLKIFTKTVDIKYIAKEKKISMEEAGRLERYNFFNEICEKYNFTKYATAHHLDDQAETFFINFFRKKGILSLQGIYIKKDKCVRPILCFTRNEIEDYLKENNLEFVEDSTNTDLRYIRNRIRHLLIPFIEKNFKIDVKHVVNYYISQIKDFDLIVTSQVNTIFTSHVFKQDNGLKLKIEKIEPKLIRIELYKKILEHLKLKFSEKLLYRIDELFISKNSTGKIFHKDLKIYKEYRYIFFEKNNEKPINFEKIIDSEGEYILFDKYNLQISRLKINNIDIGKKKDVEYLDEKKVKFPIKARFFKNGDKFQPLGLKQPVKLKKIFINRKIPYRIRKKLLILEDNENNIIFVQNLGISEKVKIDKFTEYVLKIKILLN